MSATWLIVGGGIHGVHIAVRLIAEAGCDPDDVRILDPADALLARWRACTAATGMTHLRSPAVHQLDVEPFALHEFASSTEHQRSDLFAPPYERPSLDFFNEHCDRVIDAHGIDALHVRGAAASCRVDCREVTVDTIDGGSVSAANVVFAIGVGEQLHWPDWAPSGDARVEHIFAHGFSYSSTGPGSEVAVVGGGISAAQVALRLTKSGHRVKLVSRRCIRQHQFDSDPGWLGPKHMTGFERETDLGQRRAMITEARHQGSVPPHVVRALQQAIHDGRIEWHVASVTGVLAEQGARRLRLSNGREVVVERVLLATGFAPHRPGGAMVDELIQSASLPCAECGYPIVDKALRWHPRVYVSGALAELELGPSARNIAGARRAGERIAQAARSVA
ncbi:MAG: FAD/NAD(P)-binding protein [Myxococcota bacterium]